MNQARKHLIMCVFILGMLLSAMAQNAMALTTKTLVVVGDGNGGEALTTGDYDHYLLDFINTIKTDNIKILYTADRYWTIDTTKSLELNSADLIVISRNALSANYDDPVGSVGNPLTVSEPEFWNGLPKPMIMFSAFIARTSGPLTGGDPRWQWVNSGTTGSIDNFDRIKVLPGFTTDTLFNGVSLNANSEAVIYTTTTQRQRSLQTGWLPGNNGQYIAGTPISGAGSANNPDAPIILRWTNTTIPFHANTVVTPGARRLFLSIFDDTNRIGGVFATGLWLDQYSLLTPAGKQIVKNAFNECLPGYFGPAPPNQTRDWTVFQ